ncbi:uncharacterized protein LOC6606321 [Drosophila sechellia]|uniref:GM24199 n=1 Tax=Drosophila sechellia TaxID=7238 RepID=B4HE20_DROSE|nr:uncharacterized protein LOC6606321 [Drosophila sechellia]EDW42112.1 GM24199 [Drosophila sechellia]
MAHSMLKLGLTCGIIHLLTFGVNAEDQLKNNTIVIHTPLQNYDQPNLQDYEECQENRDNCINVCDGKQSCEDECPVCPDLYVKPVMVQGINDTDIVAPPQAPINTTNIIRLTNDINNIIEHQIQNRNDVNVQVRQNVSQVGGRFGLGYTDKGSCCYVVRFTRECKNEAGRDCRERSRLRVCGEKCQARVMLAKRVVQCEDDDSDRCHETIEYVPRRRRALHRKTPEATRCHYTGNSWPYFNCGQNPGQNSDFAQPTRPKTSICEHCLNYPYGYILQYGLPAQCAGCFQRYGAPLMYNPPWMYNPYYVAYPPFNNVPAIQNNNNGNRDDTSVDKAIADEEADGWHLCDDIEKCQDALDKGSQNNGSPEHLEQPPVNDGDGDDDYNVAVQRRRRRQSRTHFVRSAYSKRNRKNN